MMLTQMLADGYTKKFATYFIKLMEREKQMGLFDEEYLNWCHSKGYLAESATAYGLTEKNMNLYLSDYDYYKLWPLNDWTRIWINDKLTLKYMLADTEFGFCMPDYYYYCRQDGLRSLCDNPYSDNSIETFLTLLREKREFACKPCNGSGAEGFVKLEYTDDAYSKNGELITEDEVINFVTENPNYIYTQFIYPHKYLYRINPKIHTLRVIVLNEDGNTPIIIGGYLRFGHNAQGESNYLHDQDSMNIYTGVNFETGEFGNAKAVYTNMIEDLPVHPDSGEVLSGCLPNYEEIKSKILQISKRFFGVEFMGFDIGITNDGFKIMEINSHPGLCIPQVFHPYMSDKRIRNYFKRKLAAVTNLSEETKRLRNNIPR